MKLKMDKHVFVCLEKLGERLMSTANERMIKSARARKRRKLTKDLIKGLEKRYYRDMKHLREKYNKIKARHHDE
jgi:hypothetical protein